jgi:hypothetical protein
VVKAFEEYAKGTYTYESLAQFLFELGVETKNHTPLGKASIWRMLSNRAYLGFTKHKGEYFEGSFLAILNPAVFEAAQQVLQGNAKPRKQKQEYNFPLRGLLTCGECGCAITGQYTPKKKSRGLFLYYRCTKKRGPCSQGFLQEKYLVLQLKSWLQKIAVEDQWTDAMLEQVERWEKEHSTSLDLDSQNFKDKISLIQDKLERLVSAYLDQEIPKEIYLAKKEELLKQKLALSQSLDSFKRKGGKVWLQPLRQWILDLKQATFVARSDNLVEIKSMVQKVGSNPQLLNKTVKMRFRPPFSFAPNLLTQLQSVSVSALQKTGPNFEKNFASSFWWR